MSRKKSNVDQWLSKMTSSQRKALDDAARTFRKGDPYNVHTLEAIYGQESSFGRFMREPGMDGAAGHFHQEKVTAEGEGMTVTKAHDDRFKIVPSSKGHASLIKRLDSIFEKGQKLDKNLSAIPVHDKAERKNIVIAALNGGQGRIARAQQEAKKAGLDPRRWTDVKKYLDKAGATKAKVEEIVDFVNKVRSYEKQFSDNCRWITKDGRHICIEQ